MPIIDAETLFEDRKLALANAKELLSDAMVLREAERWARCFFLVQIATEELGKYGIIVSSAISIKHGSMSVSRFLKRFRNHKEKTKNVLSLENFKSFLDTSGKTKLFDLDADDDYASMQEQVKFMSLYADFNESGELHIPSQIFGRDVCSTAVKLLESRIELVQSFEDEVVSSFDFTRLTEEMITEFYARVGLTSILSKK